MSRNLVTIGLFFMILFLACEKDDTANVTYGFDVSGVGLSSAKSTKINSVSIPNKPFCNLSKFEVELIYINVTMYDKSNPQKQSNHTLINTKRNQGVKINLINEKLSDKLNLSFSNPEGNCVANITIGIGNYITVNGYVDSVGTKIRTSLNGFVADGGVSQDYKMAIDTVTWLKLYSNSNQEALVESNVEGFSLVLPYKNTTNTVQMDSTGSTLEIKWLMDNAIYVWNGKWAISCRDFTTPYVKGQFDYEVYYLKRKNETKYTDILGGLFNKKGVVVGGNLNVGQIVGTNSKNVLKSKSLFGYNDDFSTPFENFFKINTDGSINFKVTQGNGLYSVFPAFVRGNHSGTVTRDDGAVIEYDCVKAE